MALFNYASKEITLKVVYYGPGLCGKTTNLQKLHVTMASDKKGKLLSLSTDADRTLFFDFMPVQLGKIKDFNIRFQLYTVPGQVRYNATRKLVLKGADAVVFVADSQKAMKEANIESFQNMKENLVANNINPDDIPVVLQYNKRDLKSIMSVEDMDGDMNPSSTQIIEASAFEGWGVDETFRLVTKNLLKFISKKHNIQLAPEEEIASEPSSVPPAPTPSPVEEPVAAVPDDQINIAVKDKAEDILAEEPAPAAYGEDSITDMLDSAPAGAAMPSDDDWGGGQDDIDAAFASVGDSIPDEPAEAEFETDSFDAPPSDSALEQMLADEETPVLMEEPPIEAEPFNAPAMDEYPAPDADNSVTADIMTEILTELRETRKMQQEMYEGMKAMNTAIKNLYARLVPRQPAKK